MSTLTQHTASAAGLSLVAARNDASQTRQQPSGASSWQTHASAAATHLRTDAPHMGPPAPLALLQWTAYVLSHPPIPATDAQVLLSRDDQLFTDDLVTSDESATEPGKPYRIPAQRAAQSLVAPQLTVALPRTVALRSSDTALGVHRQRFYPAQWKASFETQVDALLREHGQSMRWEGWDRSLPRLYLPVQQLNRSVLDLIRGIVRRVARPRFRGDELRLSVGWQSGAAQALVLTIEHPGLELSPAAIAALNAPRETEPQNSSNSEGGEFLRVARTVAALGGAMSVMSTSQTSGQGRSGIGFRISLPIDDRPSLVRAWVEQVSRECAQPGQLIDIDLHIIGRGQREPLAALQAADVRMQSLASSQDYIYRVGYGRWLWLTTSGSLPTFVSREPWRSQRVVRWKCPTDADSPSSRSNGLEDQLQIGLEAYNHSLARRELAAIIAREMDRLIGYRVPPIDCLLPSPNASSAASAQSSAARKGRWRIDAAAKPPAQHSIASKRKRWRYPI